MPKLSSIKWSLLTMIIISLLLLIPAVISRHDSILYHKDDLGHLKHDIKEQYFVDVDMDDAGHRKPSKKDQDDEEDHELLFYNFKAHDYDENLLLDGLEILSSINHYHGETEEMKQMTPTGIREFWQQKFLRDSEKIDEVFALYDLDNDGYISYGEYLHSMDA